MATRPAQGGRIEPPDGNRTNMNAHMNKRQSTALFPEFEALLPDGADDALFRQLGAGRGHEPERTQPKALAGAIASPAVDRDAQAIVRVMPRTAEAFPHVIARLAVCWHDARALAAALESLLFTQRADRAGFPLAIISELADGVQVRLGELRGRGRGR